MTGLLRSVNVTSKTSLKYLNGLELCLKIEKLVVKINETWSPNCTCVWSGTWTRTTNLIVVPNQGSSPSSATPFLPLASFIYSSPKVLLGRVSSLALALGKFVSLQRSSCVFSFFPHPRTTTHLGINGGYYSAALQQAHSTTPHEAPHSAMPPSAAQSQAIALPVSAVTTAPPAGMGHGLVSKSVSGAAFCRKVF